MPSGLPIPKRSTNTATAPYSQASGDKAEMLTGPKPAASKELQGKPEEKLPEGKTIEASHADDHPVAGKISTKTSKGKKTQPIEAENDEGASKKAVRFELPEPEAYEGIGSGPDNPLGFEVAERCAIRARYLVSRLKDKQKRAADQAKKMLQDGSQVAEAPPGHKISAGGWFFSDMLTKD